MTRILMRGGVLPTTVLNAAWEVRQDMTGANSGNLLYANGVFRNLDTPDTEIEFDGYQVERNMLSSEEVGELNEKFDAYVLPLANAFRPGFAAKLRALTRVINKLTIPCIVVGIGAQLSYDPSLDEENNFDDTARAFIAAVLEKSSMVGTRGQLTADYLASLGFAPDRDFMPIGCPSMYAYGDTLDIRPLALNDDARIAVNFGMRSSDTVRDYLLDVTRAYGNAFLVAQDYAEFRRIYLGFPQECFDKSSPEFIPESFLYRESRVKMFLNAAQWIGCMNNVDLSIGGRIHGNIAATLGGAPSVVIASDSRTRELAEFHHLPCIPDESVRSSVKLEKLLGGIDFNAPARVQKANYQNFLAFLERNGLKHNESDQVAAARPTEGDFATACVPPIVQVSDANEIIARHYAYERGLEDKIELAKKKTKKYAEKMNAERQAKREARQKIKSMKKKQKQLSEQQEGDLSE